MRRALLLMPLAAACWAGAAYGTWKLNVAQSTFGGDTQPKSLTVRIEPHSKGEVFTFDRIEADGRVTSSSILLYQDGAERDFRDKECSGTQSSRRIDSNTIEILRNCGADAWTKLVRRTAPKDQLVLEISEQRHGGRRYDRRLVFQKR
ncbi:MAG: hypothetical protein JO307_32460 [Bryobacterales bacterium]|nr:hypothetical protein [Bryobacterales bacterium]